MPLRLPPCCLMELFEEQVKQTPDAIAVVFGTQSWRYRELNAHANQLAYHLRGLGVTTDTLVGIHLKPSLNMVAGLLGILKAGGAYVPLDPTFPPERLLFMLTDSAVKLIVTEANLLNFAQQACQTVVLDRDKETLSQLPTENLPSFAQPLSRAYVLYTSGSTGQPKGVQIPHQALAHFLTSMQEAPGITNQDVLLAVTTLSFDIAGLELYLPLISGAKVVVIPRETAVDVSLLMALMAHIKPTLMQATPSTWHMLLEMGWQGDKSLKILCGGEPFSRQLADQLLERCGSLWNMYGPTETTIWSAIYPLQANENRVPLGKAIQQTQLVVLDPSLQPTAVGEPGELYIGGAGLAHGYLGRPALTAEKFLPNPFTSQPGERLYRTGDLVRTLPSGDLEFMSRLDSQVKVRGYRMELGEIEAWLNQLPAVRQAVVTVQGMGGGNQRLVAYLVLRQSIPEREIRHFLAVHLPPYMIPDHFIFLDRFPLTPNGKIDRRALPAPEQRPLPLSENFLPPKTATEIALAEIWMQVLQVEPIGLFDHFFELGGHSLQASQCVRRMSEQFGQTISLQTLYTAPTIAELAAWLEEQRASTAPIGETHGATPLPPHLETLPKAWAEQLAQQNQTLRQTLSAAPVVDQYAAGIHQRWYLKEGFRMAVMVTVDLSGVEEEERLATAVTHLIHSQPLLRSHLEGNGMEARFMEFAPVTLTDLPLLDLSAYDLAAQEQASRLVHTWLEQKVCQSPLTGQILFHLAVLRRNNHDYRLIWGLDHAIADHDCTWLVIRHLRQSVALQIVPFNKPKATFKDFLQATAPSSRPEQIAAFKQHVLFVAYMAEVRHLQSRYPMGKPILFSPPYLLDITAVPPTLTPIELTLQLAVLLCQQLFEIESVPLRILTNRRSFGGRHYDDVLGDFHDSLPVLFTTAQTNRFACYDHLRQVESQLSNDQIYPSGMGGDEEIYCHFFMSPFNFNYIGEMTASEEAAYLATIKPLGFVFYPLLAYVCGSRVCLVLLHGLATDKQALFQRTVAEIVAEFQFRPLQTHS